MGSLAGVVAVSRVLACAVGGDDKSGKGRVVE